jgi:hypothetical protein
MGVVELPLMRWMSVLGIADRGKEDGVSILVELVA